MFLWKSLSILLLFLVTLLIRAEYTGTGWEIWLLKSAAALTLIGLSLVRAGGGFDAYRRLVVGGLVLSFAGDVLLMLPQDRFVFGLGAFLLAHVCYIGAFTRDGGFTSSPATAIPLAALGSIVMALLWPALGDLRAPVVMYVVVILTMAWQALERSRTGAHDGAWWAAVGAVFFVASDAALGIGRFRGPYAASPLLVLGAYYVAQWFIATSALVRAGVLARPRR